MAPRACWLHPRSKWWPLNVRRVNPPGDDFVSGVTAYPVRWAADTGKRWIVERTIASLIGFDGPIDMQSLRLYELPEAAPAVLNGTPLLPQSGQREFAAEVAWDLPSLAPGATSLTDVTVSGARAGDLAQASLVSSPRCVELDAAMWSNNTVRVMARNISGATFDLAAATPPVA